MRLNISSGELFTDDGVFLKRLHCSKSQKWKDLATSHSPTGRFCDFCSRQVVDTDNLSDTDVIDIVQKDPSTCLSLKLSQNNIEIFRTPFAH